MDVTVDFLENTRDTALGYPYDDYRLVQQWMWFTLWTEPEASGGSSRLLKDNYDTFTPGSVNALSEVGSHFKEVVESKSTYVNFFASNAAPITAFTQSNGKATAVLQAEFYNNGNNSVTTPVQVTFYKDASLTQVIATTTVTPEAQFFGCARHSYVATASWSNLEPGVHEYWVKVNSNSAVSESQTADNIASGVVLVDPATLFLPAVNR